MFSRKKMNTALQENVTTMGLLEINWQLGLAIGYNPFMGVDCCQTSPSPHIMQPSPSLSAHSEDQFIFAFLML
ncbi:hypothetical protein XELAEV_18031148mg [Xenopus laevis]|uniref:Uncharacterized protein n=1 Tax=Xenopus laevis TaxID=8355 RepID=A0A974HFD0_XENLA|nr:hypothetical protein XELAEV_18031148mg [Xenopus laevis]